MKKIIVGILSAMLLVPSNNAWSQNAQDTVLRFSLDEAQSYAIQNSPVLKNAKLDLESAKKKVWETTSIGLPQVNGKGSYSYMITVPSFIQQFSQFGNMPAAMYNYQENIRALNGGQFYNYVGGYPFPMTTETGLMTDPGMPEQKDIKDLRWNLTFDVTVSQILFSGAWIVGLQTSKAFKNMSELAISKSEKDLREMVSNAYFLVLVSQENKQMIDSTYRNTENILSQIEAMHKQGLNEETDVEQLKLTVSTIRNAKEMLDRQVEIAKNLLRYQIGLDMSRQIVLTDDLKTLSSGLENDVLALKEFQLENLVEYKLIENQEKLALMNLRYNQSSVLPDLAAFYSHQEVLNKKAFIMTPPNLVGVGMNIPIFASGQRYARISQAKIGYIKAQNTRFQVTEGLKMGYSDAKSGYLTALNKYNTNKGNIQLSEKIYRKTLAKFQQGMASSLELTQAQNQYLQNQSNYFMSIFELISSQNKLEKFLTGN